MKRFFSILIAMMLLLSLFAINVVAFADDAPATDADIEQDDTNVGGTDKEDFTHAPVSFNAEKFKEYVFDNHSFPIEMSKTFMLDLDWLDDAAKVNEIFPGINYVVDKDDDATDDVEATADDNDEKEDVVNDVIYVLYCSPSGDPRDDMKDWSRCVSTSTFSVTTEGYWLFRFAVVDGAKASVKSYTFDWADVLATSYDNVANAANPDAELNLTLNSYCTDTTSPVVDLSTSMENKHTDGLTEGTNYSISTSLDIDDCSSTTVTYVVYKMVGKNVEGADDNGWMQIYDSKSREVAEDYKDNISASGVITPLAEDVNGEYVYKIVYTVVDAFGNYGVNKAGETFSPVLTLKVNAKEVPPQQQKVEVWKIVLYVIAGLSAVGIVILLCIRPKQQAADARYSAKANDDDANNDENK